MFAINADHMISLLFVLGLAQLIWVSTMLAKRAFPPSYIWQSSQPLFSVWVLVWPVYEQAVWLYLPIVVLIMVALCSHVFNHLFWQHLHTIWGGYRNGKRSLPWPFLSFISALVIAAIIFQSIPEFGFGLALTVCLAFPLADLLDRTQYIRLGLPLHPEQTLLGHIGFVIAGTFLCSWSVHLYHGIHWQQLLIATLIAGMAASLARALLPSYWNVPCAILAMGWILWLL